LIVRSVSIVALPVTVALHAGVGSPSTPAAKNIVSVSVEPAIVPVTDPRLLRWQELHDPSSGLIACVVTVPDTVAPLRVSDQATVVAPCESDAVPSHVPSNAVAGGAGGGATGAGDGATGDGVLRPPHAIASAVNKTPATRCDDAIQFRWL